MMILQIIFWVCLISLLHTYVIYPLLLKILAASPLSMRRGAGGEAEKGATAVSVLIPAYNEEKVIKQKLESIFSSNYPADKIEVIVGSDASTDRTNEIVRGFPQVKLVEFKGRSGKPSIINQLVTLAKHEVLILTDANVIFDKETIAELAKQFSDPSIGLVDSNMFNTNRKNAGVSGAESTYIRGEAGIKRNEGKVFGTMMGPFGGCYAVRKSLYEPVPENFLVDDFYVNMKVLEKGARAISEPNAKVYEEVPSDWKIEFKRKIRIATGSFQNLYAFKHLLFRFNALSFCFLSHKVLRWKGPFFMMGLYISNLLIAWWIFAGESIGHIFFGDKYHLHGFQAFFLFLNLPLVLLTFDLILSALKVPSPFRLLTHFFSTNLALFLGFFKFIGGVKSGIWNPTKR